MLTNSQATQTKKANKQTSELSDTIEQMNSINIYRLFPNSHRLHILLSSPWNFLKIESILEHKASLNKYKKIEINSQILLDHNGVKLEINN
jgi:hypothetical protein